MTPLAGTHPILDCAAAAAFEQRRFHGDAGLETMAMGAAGEGLARAIIDDLSVAGVSAKTGGRILVLVGKGHNGGDALLAAVGLLAAGSTWSVEVGFVFGQNRLRPLALAAWRALQSISAARRVRAVRLSEVSGDYLAVLDGIFGFQFRPPLPEVALAWLQRVADLRVRLRAAVDLPSGLGEAGAFAADATYATGILKSPLLELPQAGRLRYLDLGFFANGDEDVVVAERIITGGVLDPLRRLRPVHSDKRTFGHLAILGGSRSYPGAVAMSVAAALHSGVGLVTAFVPESIAPAMAARWPEAMWVGCPETPDGGIAMESGLAIRAKLGRASAFLIGPGLGREAETQALVADLIREASIPLVLDADGLQAGLVGIGKAARILTPHAGELARLGGAELHLPVEHVLVKKGPQTRVVAGGVTYVGIDGGPMLARGGSGDLLAGLIGGRLAAGAGNLLRAAVQGVAWHGRAAQRVAIKHGEVAVSTTALLDELNGALRED